MQTDVTTIFEYKPECPVSYSISKATSHVTITVIESHGGGTG